MIELYLNEKEFLTSETEATLEFVWHDASAHPQQRVRILNTTLIVFGFWNFLVWI